MSGILILEQTLNGLQFGLMLFLLAAGLTLVFGIMDMINLAHGSLYMVGAYLMAAAVAETGSFVLGLVLAVAGTALIGMLLEVALLRRLYQRDHLTQVLATFALILIANELVRLVFGSQPVLLNTPAALSGPVDLTARPFLLVLPPADHRGRAGGGDPALPSRREDAHRHARPRRAPRTARWPRRWA